MWLQYSVLSTKQLNLASKSCFWNGAASLTLVAPSRWQAWLCPDNYSSPWCRLMFVSRSATGESWQEIMLSCLGGQKCETDPLLQSESTDPEGGCGSDFAYFYFVSFIFFSSFLVREKKSWPLLIPLFICNKNNHSFSHSTFGTFICSLCFLHSDAESVCGCNHG